jgi:hypothetical protein
MAINSIRNNIFNRNPVGNYPTSKHTPKIPSESGESLRQLEYQERANANSTKSVVDQSISYADQLRASRTKAKQTSLEKKKLQYNFKKISSQIIRSKTSVTARKAVQAAKREIMRLKRLKANGEYDEEELQLAIDHAKSMEKVAKKKVAHLEQEEMIERSGKGSSIDFDEKAQEGKKEDEQNSSDPSDESKLANDNPNKDQDKLDYDDLANEMDYLEYEDMYIPEEIDASEYISEEIDISDYVTEDAMADLMSEINDEISEMMEELDLNELAESTYAPDPNMSADDLKMLKIKHRGKEMKEIAEADKEYLKGLMEHEKNKQSQGIASSTGSSSMPRFEAPKITPVISMPGSAANSGLAAPTLNGGFDVSV